jgi:hypothetical protein
LDHYKKYNQKGVQKDYLVKLAASVEPDEKANPALHTGYMGQQR